MFSKHIVEGTTGYQIDSLLHITFSDSSGIFIRTLILCSIEKEFF